MVAVTDCLVINRVLARVYSCGNGIGIIGTVKAVFNRTALGTAACDKLLRVSGICE